MSESPEPARQRLTATCPQCGTAVSPLYAARVRVLDEQFLYFCTVGCADEYTPADDRELPPVHPHQNEPVSSRGLDASWQSPNTQPTPSPPFASQTPATHASTTPHSTTPHPTPPPQAAQSAPSLSPQHRERSLAVASALGWLTVGLLLAEESALTTWLRAGLLLMANAALIVFAVSVERRAERRLVWPGALLSSVNFLLLAWVLALTELRPEPVINFGATLVIATASASLVLGRLFRPLDEKRAALVAWLDGGATRVLGDVTERVTIDQLRPGEEIVVHAGETVVADVTVVAGNAEILPWFEAQSVRRVGPEDFVYAGAKLRSGQLRATVRWTGLDRHWQRLTHDPARRADEHAPLVVLSKRIVYRGAPLLVLAALGTSWSAWQWGVDALLITLCSLSALLAPPLHHWVSIFVLRCVLDALEQGIVFRSAAALDAAGRVSTAVFCARGTLLLGEPELSSIEVTSRLSEDQVLALAAGAEQALQQPTGVALLRAARARGVVPDAVRSPQNEPGLGVTAIASTGKPLVVGSRGLLLRERISVARAEARTTELEALGRNVLWVAHDSHLVGLLALQDGMRAGARAAVQHLLDANIEPVLLSGDARKSCEALGRTIDIDHVRPEVLPAERGREVERLRSGGAQVAVIGQSPLDESALSAASVSIALPNPGTPNLDHDVELATNEVQRAALALRLAHDCRNRALRCMSLCTAGCAAIALAAVALSAPLAFVPLGCLAVTLLTAAVMAHSKH